MYPLCNCIQGNLQDSSEHADLSEHALAKIKAAARAGSLGPNMVSFHNGKTNFISSNIILKELSFCHKLELSNSYISGTCRRKTFDISSAD